MTARVAWPLALTSMVMAGVVTMPAAIADGTDTLGPPSIPIADADDVVVAGVGTQEQPADLAITVPDGVTIEQVLLHWNGTALDGAPPDTEITVDGNSVSGDVIGGPVVSPNKESYSVRADVTALSLVEPGTNVLTIEDMDFPHNNHGAGLTVTYSDGSDGTVVLRDGVDVAYHKLEGSLQRTEPQTIEFTPSMEARTLDLHVSVGSVGENRPHRMDVTVDGATTEFINPIVDNGPEFGVAFVTVDVPAGAESATVQLFSASDGTQRDPASLEWVGLAASFPPAVVAHCTGHAFDIRLDVTGVAEGFFGPLVETEPDRFPDQDTASELRFTVPGDTEPVATATTLDAENSGNPHDGCLTRITYEDLEVDLNNLGAAPGLPVTLSLTAVETTASAQGLPLVTDTSVTIVGGTLTINGNPFPFDGSPPPNSTIVDESFSTPLGDLAVRAVLHERADLVVDGTVVGVEANAIRVVVELSDILGIVTQTADLKVAHAEADVEED